MVTNTNGTIVNVSYNVFPPPKSTTTIVEKVHSGIVFHLSGPEGQGFLHKSVCAFRVFVIPIIINRISKRDLKIIFFILFIVKFFMPFKRVVALLLVF